MAADKNSNKMPKQPPQSVSSWAWGEFVETDYKDEKVLVTESGTSSGYRCPLCNENFCTKRKDTFRKHMLQVHRNNWKIPTMKEKCNLCQKALDPNPGKKKDHMKVCNGGEVEGDLRSDDNNNPEIQSDFVDMQANLLEAIERVKNIENEKEVLLKDFETKKEEQIELESQIIHLKDSITRNETDREKQRKEWIGRFKAVDKEKDKLTHDLKKEKVENARLLEELKDTKTNFEKMNQENKELVEQIKEAENKKESLLRDLEKENIEKKLLVEELASSKLKSDKIEEQVLKEKKDNSTLLKRLNKMRKEKQEMDSFKERMETDLDKTRNKYKDEKNIRLKLVKEFEARMIDKENDTKKFKEELKKKLEKMENEAEVTLKEIKVDENEFSVIGSGSFGDILKYKYKGIDIAVKRSKQLDAQAVTEALVMTQLKGPFIMSAMGIHITSKEVSISMEMMDMDLDKYMDKMEKDKSTEWRRKVVVDTSKAVNFVHEKNIIHRDIKPANFLIKNLSKGIKVCLTDFGLAHIGLTAKGFCGSRGYIAPEMYDDDYTYDEKVDDWSLGAVLYEVLVNDTLVKNEENVEEEVNPKPRWQEMKVYMPEEVKCVKNLLVVDPALRKKASDVLKSLRE